MINVLSIFLGGGIGAVLRHLVCSKIGNHWAVMAVNLLGALLIGIAFQFFLSRTELRPEVRAFIITGLLGGFTTFSSYMLDFGVLAGSQRWAEASFYLLGSLLLGVLFLFLGMKAGRILW